MHNDQLYRWIGITIWCESCPAVFDNEHDAFNHLNETRSDVMPDGHKMHTQIFFVTKQRYSWSANKPLPTVEGNVRQLTAKERKKLK